MPSMRLFHFDIPTWGNFGDKALFPVVRDAFRVLGGADAAGGVPNFTFTSAAALRREVDEAAVARINAVADAVVIGGGGLFLQDTNPNRLSGWQWKISPDALAALDVPLIVYALGDNRFPGQPEFDELMRSHVGQVLHQSVFFGLRNTGSMATMSALLEERERIVFQPCPTTILDHLYAPLADRRPDPRQKIVAIQMLVHARQIAAGYDAETIHEATVRAARILVGTGWTVLSTPFHPDDAEVSRRLVAEVPEVEEVRLYGHDVDFFSGLELFASVPYVLGGRGHAQMIPFGVGAIPISVDLHAKLRYFAADIAHPELVVPVDPEGMSGGESGGEVDPAEAADSEAADPEAAETLAERMVSALEDAYASGRELQADLADTRARFAGITADNLAAIHDSLSPRAGAHRSAGAHPTDEARTQDLLRAGGDAGAQGNSIPVGDAGSQGDGSLLRTAQDIRAEAFHVAAIAESEEVAALQTRALARADRDLRQARDAHARALDDARARSQAALRTVEGERDEALTEVERQHGRIAELDRQVAQLTDEATRNAQALDALRNRTAGEEASVLVAKLRHGIRWRIRRLRRRR